MPRFRTDETLRYGPEFVFLSGDETAGFKHALSRAQAYHLWYLSFMAEGTYGGGIGPAIVYPTAPDEARKDDLGEASEANGKNIPEVRRIFSWFSDELHAEFHAMKEAGLTPLDVYAGKGRRKKVRLNVTFDVPADMSSVDVLDEVADVINTATEDTEVTVVVAGEGS